MQQISIDQIALVRISGITDRAGNPAEIEDPLWASSNEAAMAVDVDDNDPMAAICTPADDAADQVVNVTMTGDADLGEGVQHVVGVLTFGITGGRATFIELEATLEDKPAA